MHIHSGVEVELFFEWGGVALGVFGGGTSGSGGCDMASEAGLVTGCGGSHEVAPDSEL